MADRAAHLATIRYSPGVNLEGHRALLAEEGISCEPLGLEDAPSDLRHMPVLHLIATAWWTARDAADLIVLGETLHRPSSATIAVGAPGQGLPPGLDSEALAAWLDTPISVSALRGALRGALRAIKLRFDLADKERQLVRHARDMQELQQVGIALTSEHDMARLQTLILRTSRELTGADAGTLYLVEEDDQRHKVLAFHVAQNDSNALMDATRQDTVMPLTTHSVAGFVASTGQVLRLDDAYRLPAGVEYSFSPRFDEQFGYCSRSMLVVPMRNRYGEAVGVIQLLNRKRNFGVLLSDPEAVDREVLPFTKEHEELLESFASQAGVALENKLLLDNIQALFAGFVRASVTAIETRDPATSGHSDRVARLTVGLARTVHEVQVGQWRDVRFSPEQIKEIEYAGLLHDFGKVGVREHVLVKAKKLYDWKLEAIRTRFLFAQQSVAHQYTRLKLRALLEEGHDAYPAREQALDALCRQEMSDLDVALDVVLAANEPTVLDEDRFQSLLQVAARRVRMPNGAEIPLLDDAELKSLTIRRGSLDDQEREEIQSHVTHSFNFLIQIPWTRELQGVPTIVYAHHEKLNGAGYPRKLRAADIPIQARMMTIADIFDALAARDRPYKAAVPVPRALDILGFEAKDGMIDADLLDLFINREVYRLLDGEYAPGPPSP